MPDTGPRDGVVVLRLDQDHSGHDDRLVNRPGDRHGHWLARRRLAMPVGDDDMAYGRTFIEDFACAVASHPAAVSTRAPLVCSAH